MKIELTEPIINSFYNKQKIINKNSFSNKRNSYLEKGSPYKKHSKSESVNTNFAQSFDIPDWGIKDYIRERTVWQKGVESLVGEPGWFYFKIFFKFNTNYGLLGGILESTESVNTAIEYLRNCAGSYSVNQIKEREIALFKFVGTLSYINENAPWFFNSVSGLNEASNIKINEPFKKNEIEIGIREDAVDMRLTTLFELYKYACFDNINLKEIIPENLRKFDMTILVFHTPLRYYQTGFQSMANGTHEYKSFNSQQFGDRMSYLMFTFSNCEFDLDSIKSVIPGEMSNDTAFNLGKSSIKINYKRVYRHTSNEWSKMFFGDGSKFEFADDNEIKEIFGYDPVNDKYKSQSDRIGAIETAIDNLYYNKPADIYKPMVDAIEKEANDIMRTIDPKMALGNLYWGNAYAAQYTQRDPREDHLTLNNLKSLVKDKMQNTLDALKSLERKKKEGINEADSSMGVGSQYFQAQLNLLKYGDETLHGPNPYMPGTPYFKKRVQKEKAGDIELHRQEMRVKNEKPENISSIKNNQMLSTKSSIQKTSRKL